MYVTVTVTRGSECLLSFHKYFYYTQICGCGLLVGVVCVVNFIIWSGLSYYIQDSFSPE